MSIIDVLKQWPKHCGDLVSSRLRQRVQNTDTGLWHWIRIKHSGLNDS